MRKVIVNAKTPTVSKVKIYQIIKTPPVYRYYISKLRICQLHILIKVKKHKFYKGKNLYLCPTSTEDGLTLQHMHHTSALVLPPVGE